MSSEEEKSNIESNSETEGQEENSQDQEKDSESDDIGGEEDKDSDATDSKDDGESQDEEEAKEPEGDPEVEIVLEDDAGDSKSQDKLPTWAKNKLKKEKGKRRKAVDESEQANAEVVRLREENDVYKRALEASYKDVQPEDKRPDHTDFEKYPDGRDSDNYQDDYDSYILAKADQKNSKIAEQNLLTQDQQKAKENYSSHLQTAKEKHYQKASKLAVSDYEATEDKAIEIFGDDLASEIILRSESPEKLLYYLGKNPKKAEEIKEDFLTDPFGASMRLGKLEDKIVVKNKLKNPAPDPDEPLKGGSPGTTTGFERKRLKMLKKSQDTGNQSFYSDFMDEHRKGEAKEKAKHLPW